ncbi:MAG: crossover junction endodeoxyribonuclease RuvC [Chitinispirillia bacterium]|nr:crossover junction endodeoxyribonuclease RuvC [Chitinispirillia bacterium]MCL2269201.1 crossover junction endodeoxyribonuclease RuvC [Chitinispirillia bacterium]
MVILGIDPGTAVTGYGVIRAAGNTVSWVDCGVIVTDTSQPLHRRLNIIYDGVCAKIDEHSPDRVSVEEAFYGKNVHTTLVLGHARGVAMLAAAQRGCEVSEYSPREIKKSVTGNGNADKDQVEYMVKMLLKPPAGKLRQDAYDALAVAMCDFHNMGRAAIK